MVPGALQVALLTHRTRPKCYGKRPCPPAALQRPASSPPCTASDARAGSTFFLQCMASVGKPKGEEAT